MRQLALLGITILVSKFSYSQTPVFKSDLPLSKSLNSYPIINQACQNSNLDTISLPLNLDIESTDIYNGMIGAMNFSNVMTDFFYKNFRSNVEKSRSKHVMISQVELISGVTSTISIDCSLMKLVGTSYAFPTKKNMYGLYNDSAHVFGGLMLLEAKLEDNKNPSWDTTEYEFQISLSTPLHKWAKDSLGTTQELPSKRSKELEFYNIDGHFSVYNLQDPNDFLKVKENTRYLNLKSPMGFVLVSTKLGTQIYVPASNLQELKQFAKELSLMAKEKQDYIYATQNQDVFVFSLEDSKNPKLISFEEALRFIKRKW